MPRPAVIGVFLGVGKLLGQDNTPTEDMAAEYTVLTEHTGQMSKNVNRTSALRYASSSRRFSSYWAWLISPRANRCLRMPSASDLPPWSPVIARIMKNITAPQNTINRSIISGPNTQCIGQ